MARIAWLALLLLCVGARAQPVPSPHAIDIPKWFSESFLDFREDVAEARREGKRVMIYFGQDGCPYCKALMTVNFRQPQIVEKTRRHFVAIALNLWGDREVTWIDGRRMTEKELGRALKVQFTPTLLFLDEQGAVALRLNGYSPPESFRHALDYASARMEKQLPYTEYLAKQKPAGASGLTPQPFFVKGDVDLARARGAKPVLVVFEQAGCADCLEMHRESFRNAEVLRLLQRFTVVQLDLRGERGVVAPDGARLSERRLARALNVVYTPTLLFLDAAGGEAFRAEGYLRPFHLESTLDYVASGAYRSEPSFQRYIQKRADGLRAAGRAVEIWK